MIYIGIAVLGVLVFATGFLVGASVTLEKATADMLDTFAETQHIRDENKYLRERIAVLESGMPAYDGAVSMQGVTFDETCGVMEELRL